METDSTAKVLIVEDELALATSLSAKFRLEEIDAVAVHTGSEAMEALKNNKFNVILLDLMLPDINGFEIMGKMREMGINTPVLVMTVLSQPEDEKRAMSLGAAEYLKKGATSLAMIVEKTKNYINKKT